MGWWWDPPPFGASNEKPAAHLPRPRNAGPGGDIRVIRLPRHGASCPVGLGVSCSADRQVKAKITARGREGLVGAGVRGAVGASALELLLRCRCC